MISGHSPTFGAGPGQQASNHTWPWTVRGDVALLMNDMGYKYDIARSLATGRSKRLNDFVAGTLQISESRIPVGRAVCGPPVAIGNNTRTLPFPVLSRDSQWRNTSYGLGPNWGPTEGFQVDNLRELSLAADVHVARAKWVALTSDFGTATAGVAFVSSNATYAVGRRCTVDGR